MIKIDREQLVTNLDELETQYNEADYLAGEMEAIETRELLLQTKEKCEKEK